MNPIFTLSIDLEKRKISATGLVAVGEKVDVVVKGVDYSSIPVWETDNTEGFIGPALRFRLVTPEGKDLVRFPLAKGDAWNKDGDSLSAEVDFNTMQLRDWLRGFPIAEKAEVGIIIDSVVDAMEYGRGTVKILQWVASPAEDPTILPDWRKTLRELNAAIVEISYKSEQAVNAATLAEYAKELAQKYVDSANVAANNALKSENEAKRFRNESLTAEQSASASANDARGARAAAESAKVVAETARDEAREYAESAQNTLEIVATKTELQNEVARATQSEAQIDSKVDTIIADDAGKSARTIAAEEVAKVVADAPADFDTLKEIAEYIESDKTGAAQMVTKIDANANAIAAETQRAQEAEAALRGAVDGKVQSVNGKTGEVLLDASDVGALPLVEDANSNKTAVTIGSRTGNVGENSLANGDDVTASGYASHAEGFNTTAAGDYSHAEGVNTSASGIYSHAEGSGTAAYGDYSHAEGIYSKTRSGDNYVFAWNGDETRIAPYESHGVGTFNINPYGGMDGFYIGEQTLASILTNKADKVANATSGNLAALDENGNLADSGKAIGDFALAESLAPAFVSYKPYEVGDLCTSFDNDENHRGTWLYKCILATDGSQLTMPEIDPTHWALATVEDVLAALRRTVEGKVDKEAGKGLSSNDYTNEDKAKLGTAYTPDNPPPAPDLSGYATKDAALPRYYFTILEIVDGVVTVPPYTSATMPGDGTAFTVAVGEGNGYMRDCILCVVCGDVAPTITWPANFHPRTDAETDFACVAGAMNVYWISEYVQGEFVVAGWQATVGGSAQ